MKLAAQRRDGIWVGLEFDAQKIARSVVRVLDIVRFFHRFIEAKAPCLGLRASDCAVTETDVLEDDWPAVIQVDVGGPGFRMVVRRDLRMRRVMHACDFHPFILEFDFVGVGSDLRRVLAEADQRENGENYWEEKNSVHFRITFSRPRLSVCEAATACAFLGTAGTSQLKSAVAAAAPAICATIKPGASAGRIPANVSLAARASVPAGFANDVEEVNQ